MAPYTILTPFQATIADTAATPTARIAVTTVPKLTAPDSVLKSGPTANADEAAPRPAKTSRIFFTEILPVPERHPLVPSSSAPRLPHRFFTVFNTMPTARPMNQDIPMIVKPIPKQAASVG